MTGPLSRRRRATGDDVELRIQPHLLYIELAKASGGQNIQVTKTQLLEATSIITCPSVPPWYQQLYKQQQ